MAEFDNMRKSLPVAYRTDKWVCDLLAAIQSLDDTQREQMLDITQQRGRLPLRSATPDWPRPARWRSAARR